MEHELDKYKYKYEQKYKYKYIYSGWILIHHIRVALYTSLKNKDEIQYNGKKKKQIEITSTMQ